MNQGPFIFLGVFFALVASWFGLVLQPQLQIGQALPSTNVVDTTQLYPQARPGLAQRGLQVYRSLGCATCHTQQIQQQDTVFDVVLTAPPTGTNVAEVLKTVLALRLPLSPEEEFTAPEAAKLVEQAPVPILEHLRNHEAAAKAAKQLTDSGGKVETHIVPVGPDIARGWGMARSVAADFLYDYPVMLGSQRIGPDLASVGLRLPDAEWHLRHLYDPTSVITNSVMPPYRFLFETRKVVRRESPEALKPSESALAVIAGSRTNWTVPTAPSLTGEAAPSERIEIVPTDDARALVAYLLSLRTDAPLLERPVSGATAAPPSPATNATSQSVTNATAL